MKISWRLVAAIFLVSSALKVLLLPSYRSTDFEVHRNWLAITSSLPLREWYFNDTSIWTLDYPPFFAYFELFLSFFAKYFDSEMLVVNNLGYSSFATILFQRLSVILTDLLLVLASYLLISSRSTNVTELGLTLSLVVFNAGLLMVDHVHFQYNGVLFGLLILCFYFAEVQQYIKLAAAFSILVLMKHLFVTLAPVVGIYLLINYCLANPYEEKDGTDENFDRKNINKNSNNNVISSIKTNSNKISCNTSKVHDSTSKISYTNSTTCRRFLNLVKVVALVAFMLVLAFGPIIYSTCYVEHKSNLIFTTRSVINTAETIPHYFNSSSSIDDSIAATSVHMLHIHPRGQCVAGVFRQIASRLFPFGRGLVHAYWAPNVYAVYCSVDKVLAKILRRRVEGINMEMGGLSSSAGLVGDFKFHVLKNISPSTAMLLVIISMLPACWALVLKSISSKTTSVKVGSASSTVSSFRPTSVSTSVFSRIETQTLIKAAIQASFSTFMFGYHVHEKAILIPIVLQTFLVASSSFSAELYYIMAVCGIFSIFPLLFQSQELVLKVMMYIFYVALSKTVVGILHADPPNSSSYSATQGPKTSGHIADVFLKLVLRSVSTVIPWLMGSLFIFSEVVFPIFIKPSRWGGNLDFVPLILVSVSCAVVHFVCYIGCCIQLFN